MLADSKRKDTFEEKTEKSRAKRRRTTASTSTQAVLCKSCNNTGHSSARSKDCPNHDFTLNELIQRKFGNNYQRYTVSIPLKSFMKHTIEGEFEQPLSKIKSLSIFLRNVVFKAQIFVNYYILKHPQNLSNRIFEQNFWYSVCRVVYENLSTEDFQQQNPHMPFLANVWNELSGFEGVSLTVAENRISNYGQVVSSACETIATSYNNYYIENFHSVIANYFVYMIISAFPNAKVATVKYLVFQHILDRVLSLELNTVEIPDDILPSVTQGDKDRIQHCIANLTLEVRNRLPTLPVTKASLNNAPFQIMDVFRHILSRYEELIDSNPVPQSEEELNPDTEESASQTQGHLKSKNKEKQGKDVAKEKFVLPRLFSLFPKPGLQWRFIKIDSQNLKGIFPSATLKKERNETLYEHTQRCFHECFDFKKLKIKSFENLRDSPQKMFLNGFYTDGYTCRVLFCKKVSPFSNEQKVTIELSDLKAEEVNRHFRPCTVDPGRRDPFVSFHGGNDIRRLSSREYYSMYGTVRRQRQQQRLKDQLGIATIEANIPSPKTTSGELYVSYAQYLMENLHQLFSFYNFESLRNRWLNYLASQKSIEESVNILLNGGKKYNSKKRRKKNKKKRDRLVAIQEAIPNIGRSARKHKPCFVEGDKNKMPLVIFGDGLKNKEHVKFRGLRPGVSGKIYRHLKHREGLGELFLLDINEFRTSKICNSCLTGNLENLKVNKDDAIRYIHQVFQCSTCGIFWNRDEMAAKNMMRIARSIWNGNGRPSVFSRQPPPPPMWLLLTHPGEFAI